MKKNLISITLSIALLSTLGSNLSAIDGLKKAPNKKLMFQKVELWGKKSAPIRSTINDDKTRVTLKSNHYAGSEETMVDMGSIWTDGTNYYISIHASTTKSGKVATGPSSTGFEEKIEYLTLEGADVKPLNVANATRYGPYSQGYQLPADINEMLKKQDTVNVIVHHGKPGDKVLYSAPRIGFTIQLADQEKEDEGSIGQPVPMPEIPQKHTEESLLHRIESLKKSIEKETNQIERAQRKLKNKKVWLEEAQANLEELKTQKQK